MINKKAREIVVDILEKVELQDAYSNVVLKETLDEYDGLIIKDKGLITEITNGTMEYKRRLDYVINQFANIPVSKMKPVIRNVLRMSVYQILFLDRVPNSAVCNEAVNIVKKRKMGGLSGFVNGVLRTIIRKKDEIKYPDKATDPVQYLGVMYSFPDWMIELWLKAYSYDFVEALCQAMNKAPELTIRVNNLLTSKEALSKDLIKEDIAVVNGELVPEALRLKNSASIARLNSFKKGYFTVQDESSMLVSHVLDPQPGEIILDACGAPGGKTTHIAELMKGKGTVVSGDIYQQKLDLIQETSHRMQHQNIEVVLQDAAQENPDYIEKFDRVLIDAPCSGLGIIRKKADIKWSKQYSDIDALTKLQRDIIKTSSQYVKPNGILVYSTCTISPLENEEMVKWMTHNLDFELESINDYMPPSLHNETSQEGYIQIFPTTANTDGFFISRFRKRG